ncbi:MAG: hypothetical protein NVSMB64_28290 [Candidatus Velthaea sp.]
MSTREPVSLVNAITTPIRHFPMAPCVTEVHTALDVAFAAYAPRAVDAAVCYEFIAEE